MENNSFSAEKYARLVKTGTVISAALSVLIAGVYWCGMHFGFDFSVGHYSSPLWCYLTAGLVASGVVIAAVIALSTGKCSLLPQASTPTASLIVRLVAAVACAASFVVFFSSIFKGEAYYGTLDKLSGILSLFAPVFFVLSLTKVDGRVTAFCALLAALSVNFEIFSAYFDFTVPINGAVRNMILLTRCAVLLFFISEARFALPSDSKRLTAPFAVFVNCASLSVAGGISLGALLYRLNDVNPADEAPSTVKLFVYFAVAAVALVRLVGIPKLLCEKIKDVEEDDEENEKGE